ncbi:MAG: YARHG domain-containing protein [Lachnospiraceae bacterium]|nr:YARHG domain-containing protein [Lachnospiraceae bacterium]
MVMALAGGAIVISSYKSVMRDGNAQNAEEIEERSSEEETIESSFMEETEEEKDERTLLLEQIPYCDQYILPLSDRIYLERADLEGLTAEQLRIARNEIYARHGRIFKDEMLNAYFQGCSWYNGSLTPEEFSDKVFNEYENANKSLIVSYEHELGVNGQ